MKYILKKEYPGSPKLGNTIDNLENDWIENYPEFWELVVEKDYEILSVITNNNKFIEKVYNQDVIIEPYWKIHSVKRLSDGEIFTIGDKVVNGNIINEFELIDNKLKVWTVHPSYTIPIKPKDNGSITGCGNMSFNWLNNIKKIKQPLFTTEDGVDIFKGDDYYHTDIKLKIHKGTNAKINSGNLIGLEGYNYFSTKEKAEEYILMNKPVLSLKDVASIYISADKPITDTTSYSAQNRRIQELVKSKIQQSV